MIPNQKQKLSTKKTVFSITPDQVLQRGGRFRVNCFILPSNCNHQCATIALLTSFLNHFNTHYETALSIGVQQKKFGRVLKVKLVEKWVKNISVMVEKWHKKKQFWRRGRNHSTFRKWVIQSTIPQWPRLVQSVSLAPHVLFSQSPFASHLKNAPFLTLES